MIFLIKRFVLIFTLLIFILNPNIYAKSYLSVKADDDFLVYGEKTSDLAIVLGLEEAQLENYCKENNIYYLAADKNNHRQIKLTVNSTDFSQSVVNLSNLSDDKLISLSDQISGFEDTVGQVVNKNGQKFLKIEMLSSDSGGEYLLTQYITVADKNSITLSFLNNKSVNTDYVEETFESLSCSAFLTVDEKQINALNIIIPVATVLFIAVCLIIGYTVIRDLRKPEEDDITNVD